MRNPQVTYPYFLVPEVWDLLEDLEAGKEELKYITITSGELFVMTPGI